MVKPPDATTQEPDSIGSLQPVRAEDLASFAQTEAARRLVVLEADKELVVRLGLRRYEGHDWHRFALALAEYGMQVLTAWIGSGVIFRECARKGIGLKIVHPRRRAGDASELAGETVAAAIESF